MIAEAHDFDISVIKIRTENTLPAVKIGNSDAVRQGDFVIAFGNPLHHTSTVTTGIVSALNRDIGTSIFDDYIQTDAALTRVTPAARYSTPKGR